MSGIHAMAFLPGGTPGGGELILIFVVALVLFGAKRLPGLARSLGRAIEEFRRAARDVSEEIHRAADASSPPSETPKPLEKESDHERVG